MTGIKEKSRCDVRTQIVVFLLIVCGLKTNKNSDNILNYQTKNRRIV